LAYFLKLPKHQDPVERELNIKREASYIIAVKNPETPSPPNTGLGRKHHEQPIYLRSPRLQQNIQAAHVFKSMRFSYPNRGAV
jgi:hypothetical protein